MSDIKILCAACRNPVDYDQDGDELIIGFCNTCVQRTYKAGIREGMKNARDLLSIPAQSEATMEGLKNDCL